MNNKRLSKGIFYIALALPMLAVLSCSTKKNTFTRRTYHNLTSHYNGYFNGKEALKAGTQELSRIAQDNYNKILPPVNYGTKENIQAISPNMDRAIAKGTKVVERHSIYIKNTEHVRWIDDAYLMIGKAYFYKGEYKTALKTFDFIIKKYKDESIRNEARIWTVKCHILMKEYDMAEALMDEIKSKYTKGSGSSRMQRDLAFTNAEYFIGRENYGPAEEYVIQSLDYHFPKQTKTRLRFILGQLSQRRGDFGRASSSYLKVIRMNPSYELAFNARINLAKCYDANSPNSKEIVKSLKKMLKDEKNRDYLDQVYYALAEISEKEGDTAQAKDYLKKSVASSIKNKYQRGLSSLKVANIYYSEPDYPLAQAYYDTAVKSLPSDYPDLASVQRRVNTLNDLVKNIKTVETEDSLQRIANMSEEERLKFIDKIISDLKAEEERRKNAGMGQGAGMGSSMLYRQRMGASIDQMGNISGTGANWYFYNPSTVSFGFTEFEKKWGKRKLEDNWRLTDKEQVNELAGTSETLVDSLAADSLQSISRDPKDRKTYLQNLPLNDAQMARSHSRIKEALFALGTIYYQGLNDYPRSEESFESLIKRYPADTSYYLKACYSLYEMYTEIEQLSKANHYKDLILSKFPDSDFAKIIRDPNYKKEFLARKSRANDIYKVAYNAYLKGDYMTVIRKSDEAKGMTEDKGLISKFDFIKTVSLGKTQNNDSLAAGLKKYITRSSNLELKLLAQQILNRLSGKDSLLSGDVSVKGQPPVKGYTLNQDAIHLFVIYTDLRKVNVSAIKLRVSDYNIKYASLQKLSTNSLYIDDSHQLITVSNFPDKEKAMDYLTGIRANNYVFSNISPGDYETFIISVDNYPILYKNKDVENYLNFFKDNYR